jgi:hypothetical protein
VFSSTPFYTHPWFWRPLMVLLLSCNSFCSIFSSFSYFYLLHVLLLSNIWFVVICYLLDAWHCPNGQCSWIKSYTYNPPTLNFQYVVCYLSFSSDHRLWKFMLIRVLYLCWYITVRPFTGLINLHSFTFIGLELWTKWRWCTPRWQSSGMILMWFRFDFFEFWFTWTFR